jgi:hypothetical protein
MCAYRFHCTNGSALVIDESGHEIEAEADLCRRVAGIARDVLRRFPDCDPGTWLVTIQDGDGRQLDVVALDELLDLACHGGEALISRQGERPHAHA